IRTAECSMQSAACRMKRGNNMAISRREFVQGAGGAAAFAAGIDSSSALPELSELSARGGQQGEVWIDALSGTRLGDEGLAEIARSGLTMIATTLGPPGTPTFSYEAAVRDLATWQGYFARYRDKLIHVRRADDILQAKREGKLAVMLGFQNATHLNRDLRNVEFFYGLGIRQIQLTY